ncbi:MAG TPA: (Fe-S)-binding protein [Desulfoprunum sp.]|nr:(Fe-S)-binding protein [Desulfoprunum sp.]
MTNPVRCAKCGACTVVCPVYKASGGLESYSARGRNHLATVAEFARPTPAYEDIFSKCLLCGACTRACPRGIDVNRETVRARSGFSRLYGSHGFQKYLARQALRHPEILGAAGRLGRTAGRLTRRLPADSGLRLRLAMFEPPAAVAAPPPLAKLAPAPAASPLTWFPGCAAEYLFPEIADACRGLLAGHGFDLAAPEGLGCCGLANHAAGDTEAALALARRNIEVLERRPGPILVSCASCFAHLRHYRDLLADDPLWRERAAAVCDRLAEMMQFLDGLPAPIDGGSVAAAQRPLRVFYHDPCHLRHEVAIVKEPRRLLQRLPGVDLVELPGGPQCCGQGGLFHLGAPDLAALIRDDLAAKVLALQPDVVTSTCSGCLMQWKTALTAAGSPVAVMHLAELLRLVAAPGVFPA